VLPTDDGKILFLGGMQTRPGESNLRALSIGEIAPPDKAVGRASPDDRRMGQQGSETALIDRPSDLSNHAEYDVPGDARDSSCLPNCRKDCATRNLRPLRFCDHVGPLYPHLLRGARRWPDEPNSSEGSGGPESLDDVF